jgi:hypothetical protein
MRSIFLLIAFVTSLIGNAQKSINLDEVSKHVGDSVKVCGLVYDTYFAARSENTPTFLNIGAKYPNQLLTVVIWTDTRKLFEVKPEEFYLNKNVCIIGKIELYNEKPQIVIKTKEHIMISN